MRNTAAKPNQTGGQHNLDFTNPDQPNERVQVGDNMDILFPASLHGVIPKRVAMRALRAILSSGCCELLADNLENRRAWDSQLFADCAAAFALRAQSSNVVVVRAE